MTPKLVDIEPIVGHESANMLREYADAIDRGEIRHYAFTAEDMNKEFIYSHASPQRGNLIGLLNHHIYMINKTWDK